MRTTSELAAGVGEVVTLLSWYRTTGGGVLLPLPVLVSFLKGAVAGDNGFEAGELCLLFKAIDDAPDEGENMKKTKPIANSAASISVMGFVRRRVRDMAISNQ